MKKILKNIKWDLRRTILLLIIFLFCLLPVVGISGCDGGSNGDYAPSSSG
ncbi:hypothetical protein ACFL02_01910 [Planctomycetota bacterium]